MKDSVLYYDRRAQYSTIVGVATSAAGRTFAGLRLLRLIATAPVINTMLAPNALTEIITAWLNGFELLLADGDWVGDALLEAVGFWSWSLGLVATVFEGRVILRQLEGHLPVGHLIQLIPMW